MALGFHMGGFGEASSRKNFIYDKGTQYVSLGQIPPVSGWSGSTQTCTFNATNIYVPLATGNNARYFTTTQTVDLTDYSKIHFILSGYGSALSEDVEVDITALNGNYTIAVNTSHASSGNLSWSSLGVLQQGTTQFNPSQSFLSSSTFVTSESTGNTALVGYVEQIYLTK